MRECLAIAQSTAAKEMISMLYGYGLGLLTMYLLLHLPQWFDEWNIFPKRKDGE